ncbi:MAG: DUF1194 domain-containing protein, partial [Rhodobacterales bacterium]
MLRLLLPLLLAGTTAWGECRLALALAVDVSRSIDAVDYGIQTEGMAAALEDAQVRAAIFSPAGEVALAVYFWSGSSHQDLVQDWVLLEGPEELDQVIWALRGAKRPEARLATALGAALVYGAGLMEAAPPCARRVLDVARDAAALLCEALQAMGDRHAVFGFSGAGRLQVDIGLVKDFGAP